jgi:hypothetical protein
MRQFETAGLALALLLLTVITGVNSVTRVRHFTPDSMAYVDAARNLNAGRGLSSSTAGLNQFHLRIAPSIPVPLTSYAPLYPVVIAAVARVGPEAAEAALIVSELGWLFVLALGYVLARRLWGDPAAWLAVAVLLVYAPLREAGSAAWSETLGLVFLLSSLYHLVAGTRARGGALRRAAIAGISAGLAFATRYALVPLLGVGPLLILARRPRATRLHEAGVFVGAALIPVAAVVLRNRALEGAALPGAPGSGSSVLGNLGDAMRILFGVTLGRFAWPVEALLTLTAVALALLIAWRREHTPVPAVRRAFGGDAAGLVAWCAAYIAFLVVVRSIRNFDPIDMRLVLPAGVVVVLLVCGFLAKGFRLPRSVAAGLLLASIAFVALRETRNLRRDPVRTTASEIAASERLAWIATNTSPRDLVIGDNAVDVSFYTGRHAIAFSPYPFTDFASEERVRAWVAAHRGDHDRYWIVLSSRYERVEDWEAHFGPWFGRLASGRDTVDAGLGTPLRLRDAIVYPYDPEAPGRD